MKLTYALLRKQRTHNLRYIVRTLLMKLAPEVVKNKNQNSDKVTQINTRLQSQYTTDSFCYQDDYNTINWTAVDGTCKPSPNPAFYLVRRAKVP